MHRKLLHRAFAQLGRWAYRYQIWWEQSVLGTLDELADYYDDYNN